MEEAQKRKRDPSSVRYNTLAIYRLLVQTCRSVLSTCLSALRRHESLSIEEAQKQKQRDASSVKRYNTYAIYRLLVQSCRSVLSTCIYMLICTQEA